MRLFLDANILFSAAHRAEGPAADLFELAASQRCELVSSSFAIDEARRNVAKDAPILAAAAQAACQLLVTGDKTHFGTLYGSVFEGVECVRLRTAFERIIA